MRQLDERSYETREVEVPVSPSLRAFVRELSLLARELDAHGIDKDDGRRYRRKGVVSVYVLRGGDLDLTIRVGKGRKHETRLPAETAWGLADGSVTTLPMTEIREDPSPDAPVAHAERLVDALVADGTIELSGGDGPKERHAQVFALAERLAPLLGPWGKDSAQKLGVWLLEQPEVDDVFGDDVELRAHLMART